MKEIRFVHIEILEMLSIFTQVVTACKDSGMLSLSCPRVLVCLPPSAKATSGCIETQGIRPRFQFSRLTQLFLNNQGSWFLSSFILISMLMAR